MKRKAYTTPQIVRAKRPKRPTKRSRMSRSRFRGRKSTFSKAISQHVYSRYATTPLDVSLDTFEYDYAHTFRLNLVKAYSEFTSLYDRYRITCVQLQITLITNPDATLTATSDPASAVPWNTTNWYPKFWYCRDYDDQGPITITEMRERSGVKNFVLRPNKEYKINVRPAILNQTYRTEFSAGYSPHWKQWIDMAQPDVPHYGLKWCLDTQGLDPLNTMPFKIRIEQKYFFTCKDVL